MADVFWDPSPEQIGIGCNECSITPAGLRSAGYEFIGKDKDSVDGGKIDLWKGEGNRWVLVLKFGVGNKIVASALCFSSQQISNVVDRFQKVLEVIQ